MKKLAQNRGMTEMWVVVKLSRKLQVATARSLSLSQWNVKCFLNEFYFLFFTFQRDLSGNQIGSIKAGVFSGLQKLSTL